MARKSRKNTADANSSAQKVPVSQQYATAIYARLSVENSGKDDKGAAIETQVEVCREYVKTCPYLNLLEIYVDNGYTGTVFSRPEFNRLMEDVRSGRIKAIVVRDLSRFGRNYIETGTYLERIFPKLDVRFIAVKEQYDSFVTDGSNESLMIPLQNMINDLYSKDISRKVSAALKVQREQGTYTYHRLPYGYEWNENEDNIVPSFPYDAYVKQIFAWFLEGQSLHEIARRLESAKIPTGFMVTGHKKNAKWVPTTVKVILNNPTYVGDKVFGRTTTAIYMGMKTQKTASKNWTVITDDHEPLVSREDFAAVQTLLDTNEDKCHSVRSETIEERKALVDILDGKVFCADCGGRLHFVRRRNSRQSRYYGVYECARYRTSSYKECSQHYVSAANLNSKILEAIKIQAATALDYEKVIEGLRESRAATDIRTQLNASIQSLTLRLKGLGNKRARLYEDFTEGILDEMEYCFAKSTYDGEYDKLNRLLDEAVHRKNEFTEALSSDNKWITLMKSVSSAEILTNDLVETAIVRVEVTEEKKVILNMKYHEIYECAKHYIEDIREKEAEVND